MSISDLAPELPETASAEETRRALLQGLGTAVVALCCVSLTYFVPALEDYRPWIDGEAVPFAHWLGGERASGSEAPTHLANGQLTPESQDDAAQVAGVDEALLAEVASESESSEEDLLEPPPTASLESPAKVGQPQPASVADEAAAPTNGGAVKQAETVEGAEDATNPAVAPAVAQPKSYPALEIAPADYDKIPAELELSSGTMDHFYRQLTRTGKKEAGAIVRVAHYGDSVIGADGMTSAIRRKLQKRFGSAGKGWVNIAPGWQWYRQKDVIYKERGWKSKTVTRNNLTKSRWASGRYGYGGVTGVGWGAKSKYVAYADRLELYYLAYPRGGKLAVRIDEGEWQEFETAEEVVADRYRVFQAASPGKHTFEVRAAGGGNAYAYGVTLETKGPGLVYDAVQMVGTRSSRLLNYDADHIKGQVNHRQPDLQIFMYGGNEVGDSGSLKTYAEKYTEAIRRMRAGRPESSCIVMTPVDHGEKYRGRIRTDRRMLKMVPIQRAIAKELGCAFYDTHTAMGGDGSSGRWYKSGLMSGDFAHLTSKGDKVLGAMFVKAVLKDFAQWLKANSDA